MDFKNMSKTALISGCLFALIALNSLINLFRYFTVFNLLWMLSYVAVAVMLILGKRDVFTVAAFGAVAANSLLSVLRFFSLPNIIGFLPNLAILMIMIVMMTDLLPDLRRIVARLWFAPAVLYIVSMGISVVNGIIYGYFPVTIWTLIRIAALLLAGLWAVAPNAGFQGAVDLVNGCYTDIGGPARQTPVYRTGAAHKNPNDVYCSLGKHIVLLLVTFGIWLYIWIYRITEYLNCVAGEPKRNPTNQLLLCLFVPFYYIYWIYQSALRIDKLSVSRGKSGDMAIMCLILALFVGILPPILMQDKINDLVQKAPVKAVYGQVAQVPQYQAPQYQTSSQIQTPVAAPVYRPQEAPRPVVFQQPAAESKAAAIAEELKIYKELVDAGVLTVEEFEAKKRQLLNL